MIKFILSFFKLKPFLGIVGAAILFVGGFGLYTLNLKREIGLLEAQIVKLKASISNLE